MSLEGIHVMDLPYKGPSILASFSSLSTLVKMAASKLSHTIPTHNSTPERSPFDLSTTFPTARQESVLQCKEQMRQ